MRKISTPKAATPAKPVTAKPAATPVAATATPAVTPDATAPVAAKPSANLTRTAATIVAQRTNYGSLSDRDTAYLSFFASFAKAAPTGVVSIADLHNSGLRPATPGTSNKPHDAGAVNRCIKAGYIAHGATGSDFTFTATGKQLAAYTAAQPRKLA